MMLIVGSGGAALISFVAGVLAQTQGVEMVMPLFVALEATMIVVWIFLPTEMRNH